MWLIIAHGGNFPLSPLMEELHFVFAVFEHQMGCPGGTVVKNPPANAGYAGLDL